MVEPQPVGDTPEPTADEPISPTAAKAAQLGLGRDDPVAPEPVEEKAEPAEDPESPKLSPEQFAAMEEKAASYDWLLQQQDLMEGLGKMLKDRDKPRNQPAEGNENSALGDMQNRLAQLEQELLLQRFVNQNEILRSDEALQYWGGYVQKGLNMQDALELTTREFERRQAPQPKAPKLQSSETVHVGDGARRSSPSRWDKQIASARNAGDAVEAAIQAVMEERAAQD